ncbi:MAG: 50S ribosomal protein L23 [Pelagibacteraceae bacterium]|jgi:large subunit ribosomal protein L23|nr:50S ribosomal protein L23 [Pelagibacteraceae bacterium]MDC3146312.1 50S ribosomal protein L23 [Alphaproteobacteria bacterium]MDC3149733.1 50S ribosomal protein L23 [Alphaproteobacteria bacterium]|tara:strand:- start:1005 stop:1286 length:282 start_codon:yes stop_codon:yes gene_type:complete
MELNLIKKPVITEKSTANAQFNKYIFEVRNDANKINIKKTIEEIYKVKVQKLNSLNVKSKPKVFKGQRGTRSELKRIIVTLKEGNTIDMSGKV